MIEISNFRRSDGALNLSALYDCVHDLSRMANSMGLWPSYLLSPGNSTIARKIDPVL